MPVLRSWCLQGCLCLEQRDGWCFGAAHAACGAGQLLPLTVPRGGVGLTTSLLLLNTASPVGRAPGGSSGLSEEPQTSTGEVEVLGHGGSVGGGYRRNQRWCKLAGLRQEEKLGASG